MVFETLKKIFTSSPTQPSNSQAFAFNDILLSQGDLFLSFQKDYYKRVSPHLSLIEQTSAPKLNSFIEGMATMTLTANRPEPTKIDGTHVGSGSNGAGSNGGGTDSGGTDSGGTDNGGTDSGGTDSGGTDSGGTDSGGSINDSLQSLEQQYNSLLQQYVATSKQLTSISSDNISSASTLQKDLLSYNNKLLHMAELIYKKIEQKNTKLYGDIDHSKKDPDSTQQKLLSKIDALKKQKTKLTNETDAKYRGEYADNQLRINYAYYHYIIWFIVVVVLISAITMISLNFPFPTGFFWSLLYVIIILSVLWLLTSAIRSKFWQNI